MPVASLPSAIQTLSDFRPWRIRLSLAVLVLVSAGPREISLGDEPPAVTRLVEGLKNPESVAVGPDGRIYVSTIGDFEKEGDGAVMVIENGKAKPLAKGLDDPKGLAAWGEGLVVTDKTRVLRIDLKGKVEVLAGPDAFPTPPLFLNDIVAGESGALYVSDSGDFQGKGAIYRVSDQGQVTLVVDSKKAPALKAPNGLLWEESGHLLVADAASGELYRVATADGSLVRYLTGFTAADGLARDARGKLFVSEWLTGRILVVAAESRSTSLLAGGFQSAADICLDAKHDALLAPDMLGGTVSSIGLENVPALQLDESPLAIETERAFPELTFERPIVLTHGGDGTNRVYVASQLGRVFVFPNDQEAAKAEVFLDIHDRVQYKDSENEEGFLGMAFHPRFKQNGELFVYYTTTDAPHTSVISRFRRDKGKQIDPSSEEELLRIPQPFWNHNGGTLAFGPDGMLYIGLGDGGRANDPFGHGQNLKTLLGAILRIDVDHHDKGKMYAVPKDNPFLDYPHAAPEIWAYGVRNIWRMSFDRETGRLWAADVGQDLWEEIDLIEKGGNYGWNLREGAHPFGIGGVQLPREDIVEPIHEYHHEIGKSITGGYVYRGKRLPALQGAYLYADYVTGKIWALRYDEDRKRTVANHPLTSPNLPVMSFGEDEMGELYFMTPTGSLHRFKTSETGSSGK